MGENKRDLRFRDIGNDILDVFISKKVPRHIAVYISNPHADASVWFTPEKAREIAQTLIELADKCDGKDAE